MTDNEIIKDLDEAELFLRNRTMDGMSLEYDIGILRDISQVCARAYDEITRQKAEIDRLQEVNDSFTDIGKLYSEIKAEAIKEFAERVKEFRFTGKGIDGWAVNTKAIDNLVKEMVGDNNV